ncbi:hypothetical protein [Henriciella sp.]|uniref:hypothetical protein n=1 Tax=Henriciella sp. TaxID=1968823 RepID=UPI000C0CBCCB|nr:hypothetical protein [Henriciella sp.]PHR77850.1 MAG: hypothetical protein COA64_08705 [Henriciella sp.]
MGESETNEQEAAENAFRRARSKIQFPYTDLSRAEELCHALLEIAGRAETEQTQLAVKLDMSANGGTFRGRLSAAKMFGLIETPSSGVRLTGLGRQILERDTKAAARAEAFTNVELYSAMYDRYNGYSLPPAAAVERQMVELGVPPKQKERARQAFASSAETAGFVAPNGRFCKPALAAPLPDEKEDSETTFGGGGGGGSNDQRDQAGSAGRGGGDAHKPAHQDMTDMALEYRLVDLITEAHQKDPQVVSHIIAVITFLKTKDLSGPGQKSGEG